VTRGKEQPKNETEIKARAALNNLSVDDFKKIIALCSPDSARVPAGNPFCSQKRK